MKIESYQHFDRAATNADLPVVDQPVGPVNQKLRIALMGAPIGIGNRGVSALGVSVVRLLFATRTPLEIALLIGSRSAEPKQLLVDGVARKLPVIHYRLSPKAGLQEQLWWIVLLALAYRFLPLMRIRAYIESINPWLRAAAQSDLVVDIRGGDSFSDIYGLSRFLTGALTMLTMVWVRGRIALLPQTYGPYKTALARSVARYIFLHSDPILSRDRDGLEIVDKLSEGRKQAVFCPDVAFALEPSQPKAADFSPPLARQSGRTLVGLNVNGLMYNGGYTRQNMFGLKLDYPAFLDRLLVALLDQPDTDILLVPHTFAPPGNVESDNEACRLLAQKVPAGQATRVHTVVGEPDQHGIKGIIGMCDFFVGSRMHACIAALSQGIPAVGVAYSKKFEGVFESVGANEWVVDGRAASVEQALETTMEIFHRRDTLKVNLSDRVREAQRKLATTFAELLRRVARESQSVSKSTSLRK